jgi:16S rRNA (guanine966-N2)-methyltransferase
MRVITGIYKGRTLRTVKDLSVRPATDRVRQTVFNMLENRVDFDGASVLDLFAGSGSLGIEALSRGAARAIFVESGREAASVIRENLKILGCTDASDVYQIDALEFVDNERESYDLVFADPPYAYGGTPDIPRVIFEKRLIRPGGYLVVEHSTDIGFENTPLYDAGPVKKFGRTLVTFFRNASNGKTDRNLSRDV